MRHETGRLGGQLDGARPFQQDGGTLDRSANRTGGEGDPSFRPRAWLRKQDKAHADGKLAPQQTALLDALQA
ncbi:hypothetical protein [Kitasatospora sp. NPDC056181]|uniref:hypothetical protein n=1 Tax=Kitasatospora sp. NPDC056181 TaxID=3345737 RepID=UPI0035DC7C76